jgi:hypothetical protein
MRIQGLAAVAACAVLQACGGDPCAAGKSVFTGQPHPDCPTNAASPTVPGAPVSSGGVVASGAGNGFASIPAGTSAVQIEASTTVQADAFAVYLGGQLVVNEVLTAERPVFSGSYAATPGSAVTVEANPGTRWSITGTTLGSPGVGRFTAAGIGDMAFSMPERVARYRVRASYSGTAQNFILTVGGRSVVNVVLGSSRNVTQFENVVQVAGGTAAVSSSTGVSWSISEETP